MIVSFISLNLYQVLNLMFSQKALLFAHDAHFGIHAMLHSIPKTRLQGLKQFGIVNVQHFMNLFPKVAKIARKRLFTILSNL